MAFRRNSTNVIELRGLTREVLGTSVTSGLTTSSWIFDQDSDSVVDVDSPAGTTLSLRDPSLYKAGDKIRVELDTGAVHDTTVSGAPNVAAGTLELAGALPSQASSGRPVSRPLGVEITGGSTFGAAAQTPKKDDWGWAIVIAKDDAVHAELYDVDRIRIEVTATDSAGVLVERLVEAVQG